MFFFKWFTTIKQLLGQHLHVSVSQRATRARRVDSSATAAALRSLTAGDEMETNVSLTSMTHCLATMAERKQMGVIPHCNDH